MKFVAIGNVAIDENLQNSKTCGGSVFYASLFASKIGSESIAVTSFGKDFLELKPNWHSVRVCSELKAFSTTFRLIYDKKGNRQAILKKEGGSISKAKLKKEIYNADIIFVCPIAHEITSKLVSFIAKEKKTGIVVTTPQGWLRNWNKEGEKISQRSWNNAKEILQFTDVLIISDEDIKDNRSVLKLYKNLIKKKGIVIVTQGSKGAVAYSENELVLSKAYPAKAIDPTGAGDIFAAAFGIAFKETASLKKALKFANAAASFIIEGIGVSNMPTRPQILARINTFY